MQDFSGVIQNFDEIMQVIYLLVAIIAGLKFERHVTKQEADRILDKLERLASGTKNKLDDSLVTIGRMLNNLRPERFNRTETQPTILE